MTYSYKANIHLPVEVLYLVSFHLQRQMGTSRITAMSVNLYNPEIPPKFKISIIYTHTQIQGIQHRVKIKV